MGGAGVTVEQIDFRSPEAQRHLVVDAFHRLAADMVIEGLDAGRPEYRIYWALVEADRGDDSQGYAVALWQVLKAWAEAEVAPGLRDISPNGRAVHITGMTRHVLERIAERGPDWTPAWRDEGSAG